MKKLILIVSFFISALISMYPQNLNGRLSSSYYSFDRYDSALSSATHLRAFQMANINFNQGNFSVRTYLNLEYDLLNPQKDDPRLRVYNLYLEERNIFKVFTVKLGRQPLFNSVGGGIFDGINVDFKKDAYKLTAYYGSNVPAYQKFKLNNNWSEDYIAGGKFRTSVIENFDISLGYIKKNFKPQEYWATRLNADLNPITILIQNNSNQFEFANAEVSYNLQNYFTINTKYDYDLKIKKTSKFEISGTYEQLEDLHLSVYYNYREPLVRYNSIFSVFDYGNTQEIELSADYLIAKSVWLTTRYGNVKYRDDNSQRITLGINSELGSISYRKTFGYAGELDALSLYSAKTFSNGEFTPSAGISYTSYQLTTDAETNHLVTLLAGFNYRPMRFLSFDIQGQYMDNKIYRNDYRLFLKANYWFNTNF